MGKSSRKKGQRRKFTDLGEALKLAGSLVRSPGFIDHSFAAWLSDPDNERAGMAEVLGNKEAMSDPDVAACVEKMPDAMRETRETLRNLTVTEWAASFRSAFRNEAFCAFVQQSVDVAQREFPQHDPIAQLQRLYGETHRTGNLTAATAPIMSATYCEMMDDPTHPRWVALCIYCLGSLISGQTRRAFQEAPFDELTGAWISLERSFLFGIGEETAGLVVWFEEGPYAGKMAPMLGIAALAGLAEAAADAPSTSFFSGGMLH
ncbi:hypothetical protein [Paraburkholderia youngii]|uniref:hypothetical protein n=1 Tax=Paraburkholderia youngii TaxID=2782701 RepID=UPI003D1CB8ED